MRRIAFSLSLAVGCLAAAIAIAADKESLPTAILADGEPFQGRLVAVDVPPAWQLRFDVAGQIREVVLGDLVMWGGFVEPARGVHIIMADGGVIVATSAQLDNERLRADARLFGKIDLPIKLVSGVIFHPPLDPAKLDQFVARVTSSAGHNDRVLLDNGDELTGTVAELTPAILRLQIESGKIDVDIGQLSAVIFNPLLVEKQRNSGLRALVGFFDGSRVTAVALVSQASSMQLKLAEGADISAQIDSIVAVQTLGGRTIYLSDLMPASYRHLPYLQLGWPLKTDRSVLGRTLRAGGHVFAKGLGMHSPARVTYELDKPFRRFESEVALDAECGDRGSVVFRVFVNDGSGKLIEAAKSETVRGGDPPVPISVDLAGAKRISLLVDFADHGDELDHADWLNARLVR